MPSASSASFSGTRIWRSNNLDHPYFEVRAIAVRHAPLFHLPRLMDDIDETVRSSVARRLPRRLLLKMRNDHDREVRSRSPPVWKTAISPP